MPRCPLISTAGCSPRLTIRISHLPGEIQYQSYLPIGNALHVIIEFSTGIDSHDTVAYHGTADNQKQKGYEYPKHSSPFHLTLTEKSVNNYLLYTHSPPKVKITLNLFLAESGKIKYICSRVNV